MTGTTATSADDLALAASEVRRCIIDTAHRAGAGHIGSALSVVEAVVAVYAACGDPDPDDDLRSRVVLSKGHAALAQYAELFRRGVITRGDLEGYCSDGTVVGVHPDRRLRGVDFSTGSLGHGLPMAVGAALAARMQGSSRLTAAVVSDAECNEGSVWESVMFAGHQRLSRLRVVLDDNGMQALGRVEDISRVGDAAARWEAFGWTARTVDGHDAAALLEALTGPSEAPVCVVARTTLGRGVDFMENRLRWHYSSMSADEHAAAAAQVGSP